MPAGSANPRNARARNAIRPRISPDADVARATHRDEPGARRARGIFCFVLQIKSPARARTIRRPRLLRQSVSYLSMNERTVSRRRWHGREIFRKKKKGPEGFRSGVLCAGFRIRTGAPWGEYSDLSY